MLLGLFFFLGRGDEKETRTDGQKARGGGVDMGAGHQHGKILLGIVVLLPALR